MTFTSGIFAIFVVITIGIYYLFPIKKYQWTVLLAASYFFYLYNSFKYSAFILITTTTIYFGARLIEKIQMETKSAVKQHKGEWSREEKKLYKAKMQKKAKYILASILIFNFGVLVFLKYYNFLAGGLNTVLGLANPDLKAPFIKLFLPLGVSFYTFQATGYLIDVYRENAKAENGLFKFALFVSFFPQIVQGPISRFNQLQHQLIESHKPNWFRFKLGCELILWGLFKKLIIADRMVTAIDLVTKQYNHFSGTIILFGALMYAFQLYADFSGGIDIARGIAKILGIDMTNNFRQPYFSKSINEYWRRWHISLGEWMKEYIFYSLAMSETFMKWGKNMKNTDWGKTQAGNHIAKTLPAAVATFVVFLAVGIWHGANSKYLFFGIWNGGIIMVSMLMKPLFDKWTLALKINVKSFLWRLFQMVRTFILVLIGYYFDIAPNFTGAMEMMWRTVARHNIVLAKVEFQRLGFTNFDIGILIYGLAVVWTFSILLEKSGLENPGELINGKNKLLQWCILFVGLLSVIILGIYGPDASNNFVYMQF